MRLLTLMPLLASAAGYAAAGQDTVRLCDVDFQLGQSKERVLEAASPACTLKKMTGIVPEDYWTASENGVLHMMLFKNGTLSFVEKKTLHDADQTSAAMVSKIFSFIRAAQSEGRSVTVSIGPKEGDLETFRIRSVTFTVGDKAMTLRSIQPIGSANSDLKVETGPELTESLLHASN